MSSAFAATEKSRQLQGEPLERLSYLVASGVMTTLVAGGFRQFCLHGTNPAGRPVTQPIARLVYLHAALMTA